MSRAIEAGQDFVQAIEEQVRAGDAMLVLIGPNWLTARDDAGRRRLEHPEDFVRIEIDSALFGKRVIPVLLQKAEMPRGDALPEALKALARRNAFGLTHERFRTDAQGLIKALESALAEVEDARRQTQSKAAAAQKQRAAEHAAKAEEAARSEKERERGLTPSPACHRNRSPRRKSWPTGISSRPAKAARNSAITWPASRKG